MAIQQEVIGSGAGSGERGDVEREPRTHRARRGSGQSPSKDESQERLANALGWFSIGLGLAQVAAPRGMARLIGATGDGDSRAVMRMIGMRELATGVGILTRPRPAGWVMGRVAGDVIDLALLGSTLTSDRSRRNRTAAATAAVVGVTALDVYCATRLGRGSVATQRTGESQGGHVRTSITVNRPIEEVYAFWHDFENLPRFMSHLDSVRVTGERRSHWIAKAPAGRTVEWDAEIVEDSPNELIAWSSLKGADVHNAGLVRFTPAPGGRGTEVHVELRYDPPAGKLGVLVAKLLGEEPAQQVRGDLRRFKQVMETGEVVLSDASVHRGPHPAQPPGNGRG